MPGDDREDLRISVVIPAFNAAATVVAAVRSALAQTVPELEVIVVDDGSNDRTQEVLADIDDPRLRVLAQTNSGPAVARNTGLALAAAPVVAFLDGDDLLLPTYAAAVLDILDTDPEVGFVYTDAWTFDDRTRRVREWTTTHFVRPPRPGPGTSVAMLDELIARNFIIIPVAARASLLREAGGFDAAMVAAEDWDLWLRLTVAGYRGAEAPGPLGLRREHDAQQTTNFARMWAGAIQALDKLAEDPRLPDDSRARVDAQRRSLRARHRRVTGEDRWGGIALRARWRLGAARRSLGFGSRYLREAPGPVRDAFGDLSGV